MVRRPAKLQLILLRVWRATRKNDTTKTRLSPKRRQDHLFQGPAIDILRTNEFTGGEYTTSFLAEMEGRLPALAALVEAAS